MHFWKQEDLFSLNLVSQFLNRPEQWWHSDRERDNFHTKIAILLSDSQVVEHQKLFLQIAVGVDLTPPVSVWIADDCTTLILARLLRALCDQTGKSYSSIGWDIEQHVVFSVQTCEPQLVPAIHYRRAKSLLCFVCQPFDLWSKHEYSVNVTLRYSRFFSTAIPSPASVKIGL